MDFKFLFFFFFFFYGTIDANKDPLVQSVFWVTRKSWLESGRNGSWEKE